MTLGRDYRVFAAGQVSSRFGSAFTDFGLPLLAFKMTGSPVVLAIAMLTDVVPYLFFGLPISAWVDRSNRRRAAIVSNLFRTISIGAIPVLWFSGSLSIPVLLSLNFVSTGFGIVSLSAESAALPAMVGKDQLLEANSRLQGAFAVANVAAPLIAGGLIAAGLPIPWVFGLDALTFVISACSYSMLRTSFSATHDGTRERMIQSVRTGLRYVGQHKVLRNIAIVAALYNLLAITVLAQMVNFATVRLGADGLKVGLVYGAAGVGTVFTTYLMRRLQSRLTFRALTLGSLAIWGAAVMVMSWTHSFWLALALWTVASGMPVAFTVQTATYRQRTVPNHLLGRVQTLAAVVAWSCQPFGALVGALAIKATGDIASVYATCAAGVLFVAVAFSFGPLAKVDADGVDAPAEGRRWEGTHSDEGSVASPH